MKCSKCNYDGRGSRGYWTSLTKGEHWRCPKCGELTKIPVKKRLPSIKGYCKDCVHQYKFSPGVIACEIFSFQNNTFVPDETHYCNYFKGRK